MIAIIDYGVGNLFSLEHSFMAVGADPVVTGEAEVLLRADHVILPGVGAFGDAAKKLRETGLDAVVKDIADRGTPVMGICLGHQSIAQAFGGRIVPAKCLMHGKTSRVRHDGKGIFEALPQGFEAMRYHSLAVERATLPDCFEISAESEDGEIMLTLLASFAEEEVRSLSENVRWAVRKKFERGRPNSYCMYGYRWDGEKFIVEPEEAKIVRLIYQNFLDGLSAEETEKQLEQMGVKSYTGQHFSNSSIRSILRNEKYTGNMLLQKEYTESHITHKSKKNNGELPMYWVENSHEAIIPLETYQKVQDEIKRRRELGALANWHIPTSHFTSKIKCGCCGASFVKSTRKNRAKCSQIGENYSFYQCASKKKGSSPCTSGTIRESVLEEECAKALGLSVFDPEAFTERVRQITIPEVGTMVFELTDGQTIEHHWHRNARKESWTPELREQASAYRKQNPPKGKKGVTCLTAKIRCGCCGENYRRQAYTNAAGEKLARWYCANQKEHKQECKMPGVDEAFLKATCAEALGIPAFDDAVFTAQVDHITITGIGRLTIFFKDGHTYDGTYAANRYGAPYTEERRRRHSEIMKKYWRERNGD